MKVFVLGATGYVGEHVAAAFRRAGHEVWGLTRNPEKGRLLARREIRPVVGDMQRPESYRGTAEASDVLVQAAQDYLHDTAALDLLAVQSLLDAARTGGQPRTLLYTGGAWDYGNTAGRVVDEQSPVRPLAAIAWRPAIEQLVLEAREVRGVVVRPGNVYGYGGKLTSPWFAGATGKGPFRVVGTGDNHWPMVHVDDLARGYVLAAESGVAGEIVNLSDGTAPTVREMVEAIARTAAYRGEITYVPLAEAAKILGPMAEALAQDARVDTSKARHLLGWQPRHRGFLSDVPTYLAAWQAAEDRVAPGATPSEIRAPGAGRS